MGTLAECSFVPGPSVIAFMFLLLPDRDAAVAPLAPGRRGRVLLAGLTMTGLVVTPRLVQLPAPGGTSLIFPNPLGVRCLEPVLCATVPIGTLNGLAVGHRRVPGGGVRCRSPSGTGSAASDCGSRSNGWRWRQPVMFAVLLLHRPALASRAASRG